MRPITQHLLLFWLGFSLAGFLAIYCLFNLSVENAVLTKQCSNLEFLLAEKRYAQTTKQVPPATAKKPVPKAH